MALIDKASLLMVPSVYEDGTLYNVLPSGNKAPDETGNHNGYDQTRADFTFSRGFNLTATRVNASGLIEKGRENLLLQSNQFDVSANWGIQDASVISGQSGYDGTNNAWLFSRSSSIGYLYQQKSFSASINTASIYVKGGASSTIRLDFVTASFAKGASCSFDLSNGTAGSVTHYGSSSGFLAAISSVGNDWYRISLTGLTTAETWYHELALTSGNIYIQNAQLEAGLVSTPYIETGATTATAGILENTPRIDYSSGAGSLKLEPQRTNLLAQSEYIHGWLNAGGTSSQNSTESTSPEGKYNAAVLDASSVRYLTHSISSSTHSYSVYAKAKSGSIIGLRIDTPTTKTTNFDLSNGTISATGSGHTPSIESVGNGWYRCSITFTDSIVNTVLQTTTSGSVYLWGAQLESSASYPSSYVPTYGSAATRGADSCSVTGVSDVIGQTEGTLFLDLNPLELADASRYLSIESSSGAGSGWIGIFASSPDKFRIYGDGFDVNYNGYSVGDRAKIALTYKNGVSTNIYINGVNKGSITANTTSKNYSILRLGSAIIGGVGTGEFNQCTIYPTALTDAECVTLTTL